jgi:TolB-like protein
LSCEVEGVELAKTKQRRIASSEDGLPLVIVDYAPSNAKSPTSEQILAQAEKILQASTFVRSNRSRKLLQYLIERALAGNSKRLKQYSIATEALGRSSDFDPDTDPIVRLEASKLRRALDDYYLRSGSKDAVRISVPKGGYVPSFELLEEKAGGAAIALAPTNGANFKIALSVQRLLIVPFQVQVKGDATQALTDGVFEQLNVELARYSDISLVSEPRGEAASDPVSAGNKAHARFVVSGSVRQNGEQIRITVRLYDAPGNSIIWMDCFDFDASARLGLQAEESIARRIAGVVADYYGVISNTLSLQSVYSAAEPCNLQDTIQRHRYFARTLTERGYRIARADLELGMTRAAFHPMIWAALAHTIFYGNVLGFDDEKGWMTIVYRHAQRSFELDHRCALGHVVMALHGLYHRELDDVIETCKRIEQDNPHAPSTQLSAGFFRALAGDWDHGVAMLKSALPLMLHPPGWAYRATFLNHYRRRDYAEALYEIANYHAPENFTPSLLRAAALAQLGRLDEASISAAEVMRICPRFAEISPRYFRYLSAFDDISGHVMQGLQKAGLKL